MRPRVNWIYELRIRGTYPRQMPMESLGEVLHLLAELMGEEHSVHLGGIRKGSARLLVDVEPEAEQGVLVNLLRAKQTDGKQQSKVVRLDQALGRRGWRAQLMNRAGAVVLDFPGAVTASDAVEEREIQQADSLVGTVIKIGGRDETVPMTLETGPGTFVDVTIRGKELARQLAPLLFGAPVRVYGTATWRRNAEGQWSCSGMTVTSFDRPDSGSLAGLFEQLAQIPSDWNEADDPQRVWLDLRRGEQ